MDRRLDELHIGLVRIEYEPRMVVLSFADGTGYPIGPSHSVGVGDEGMEYIMRVVQRAVADYLAAVAADA